MEKYFLEIINLLIDNNTEQIYRKIMLSILDIIIENPILCMSIYKPYINSAENYWRYYDETIDNLEKYRKEVIEIALLKKWSTLNKKDKKNIELNHIYRLILTPFKSEELDRNCDNLYWFIECINHYGISSYKAINYFKRYF